MEPSFNPYLKWLGIPLNQQPPHHYRLLGCEAFETDPEVIERAGDRQMTYLRSLQTGSHAQLVQKVLEEVAKAQVVLLDPEKKAAYDAQLSKRLKAPRPIPVAAAAPAVAVAVPAISAAPIPVAPVAPIPVAPPAAGAPFHVGAPRTVSYQRDEPADPNAKLIPYVIGAGALAVGLLIAVIGLSMAMSSFSNDDELANLDGTSDIGATDDDTRGSETIDNRAIETSGGSSVGTAPPPSATNPSTTPPNVDEQPGVEATRPEIRLPKRPLPKSPVTPPAPPKTPISPPVAVQPKPAPSGALHVEIDAPFAVGTLAIDSEVLSDRDYTFTNLDSALQNLKFTRWSSAGPPEMLKLVYQGKGRVYLIVPPIEYARPIEGTVSLPDWKNLAITCEMTVEGGGTLPCAVLVRDINAPGTFEISAGVPFIIAAASLDHPQRILGDIVGKSNGGDTVASNVPPNGIGGNPDDERDPFGPPDDNQLARPAQVVKRIDAPDADAQAKIRADILKIYEVSSLKTPEDRVRVANKLISAGQQPSDKNDERYMLLWTGAQLATHGGDLGLGLATIEEIGTAYNAPTIDLKLDLVKLFAKATVPVQVKQNALPQMLPILDEALTQDRFADVAKIVEELTTARLRDPELGDRRKTAIELKATYAKVEEAQKKLTTSPDDPEANLVAGTYLCFVKRNWQEGLPLLAKGDDIAIRDAARMELASPDTAPKHLKTADAWMKAAESKEGLARSAMVAQARGHFNSALPSLSGLDEVRVKKSLDEIESELAKAGWAEPPREATIVVAGGYGVEVAVNGQIILQSFNNDSATTKVMLKSGDVVMFRARKSSSEYSSYNRGFSAVVWFPGTSRIFATGISPHYQGVMTKTLTEWTRPRDVDRTRKYLVFDDTGSREVTREAGIECKAIWAANVADAMSCYALKIP